MSQRSTVSRSSPRGSGLDLIGLLQQGKDLICCITQYRQGLACFTATLTMFMVGTVYGWTTTSLLNLTSGTDDVPLTLSNDEYSWIVSLTVLGAMIGSLVGVLLADRSGRKYGLLICSALFTAGWMIIYVTAAVRGLYFARVIHGIGVGIAYTINPMYVSEVADMDIKGALGALIAVNVYTGSLLTCTLGPWMTYDSLLLFLVIVSFISFLSNTYFPETPYFLVAKGRKTQACKSIAYYKNIVDSQQMQIELRTLRSQTRYELHPQLRYEEHQQSGTDLPLQSRNDVPSQAKSNVTSSSVHYFASQSGQDSTSPSRSDLPSPPRSDLSLLPKSDLPLHSRNMLRSRLMREEPIPEVDTDPISEGYLPSSSDSTTTSAVNSEVVVCQLQPAHTGELRGQTSRSLYSQSTSEYQRPSTTELHRRSVSELNTDFISDINSRSRSDSRSRQSTGDFPTSIDMDEIQMDEIHMVGTKSTWLSKLQVILQRNNKKALLIMLGLIMAQQLSGNFVTTQYLEMLTNKTMVDTDPYDVTMMVQFVNLVSGSIAIVSVDFLGRRTLLIASTLGSCITLTILATYFLLAEHIFDVSIFSVLPVIDLVIYQGLFQIGLGTLPNVLLCELFPTELKGFVGAIIVIFNGIVGFTVSKLYEVIIDNIGSSGVYFIFATSCCLAYVLVFLWIPETKGKTYEEIKALLARKNLNSTNEEVRSDRGAIHSL